jgi:hypothetical protein
VKWKHYPLPADDERAMELIQENLQVDRTLAAKLRERFPLGSGELFAIAQEGLDVDSLQDFRDATYGSGMRWYEAAGTSTLAVGDRAIDGLTLFLKEFLLLADRGAVVIANWIAKRTDPHMSPESRSQSPPTYLCTSRLTFFGDEVHHVLTPEDTDLELIEDTISEPWHHWFVGVCAAGFTIPDNNEFSADSLDELVARTEHIFVPAFDDEGFLVWSP